MKNKFPADIVPVENHPSSFLNHPTSYYEEMENKIDFRYYLNIILKHKRLILGVFLGVVVAAAVLVTVDDSYLPGHDYTSNHSGQRRVPTRGSGCPSLIYLPQTPKANFMKLSL